MAACRGKTLKRTARPRNTSLTPLPLHRRSPRVPTVLVIEDEPEIRELLSTNLKVRGYDAIEAADGADAIDLLFDTKPDVVVLDIMMPEVDGLEVLEFIRGRKESQLIPVILVTALDEEADRVRGLGLGAQDYVVKPFSIEELMLRIAGLAANRERESQLIMKTLTDAVTDLYNSRYLAIRLPALIRESHGEMSLLWISLDGLEQVVGERGILFGEKLEAAAASIIRAELGVHEEGFSLGGGHFAITTYRTGVDAANWEHDVSERLKTRIRPLEIGAPVMASTTLGNPRLDESSEEFLARVSSRGRRSGSTSLPSSDVSLERKRSVAEIIAARHKARRDGS